MKSAVNRLALRFPRFAFSTRSGIATATLIGEELAAAAYFTERERNNFMLGRECAREALATLGYNSCSLPRHSDGGVVWPAGIVGSLSHKRDHCVAVVGISAKLAGVGIDLELIDIDDNQMIERIATPRERAGIAALGERCVSPATLLLASKEAVYKAQFRRHGRELDWGEVEIDFDDRGSGFHVSTGDTCSPGMVGAIEVQDRWIVALAYEDLPDFENV
jgi:4'-phosphopantetheinyl transferase EntD